LGVFTIAPNSQRLTDRSGVVEANALDLLALARRGQGWNESIMRLRRHDP